MKSVYDKSMKKETALKWSLVLGVGYYLYYKASKGDKESNLLGFEASNPEKIMDSVIPWLNVNDKAKPFVHSMGKRFLKNVIDKHKNEDIIDVEYRSL